MKIAVIGTGYVGLVTGTCFAEVGNHVTCIDIDEDKINRLKKGRVPIYEAGLDDLVVRNVNEGRLEFTTGLAEGLNDADIIFLALPTPPNGDGSADLSYILDVSGKLGPLLKKYTIIIDKSTVPVGTAKRVQQHVAETSKVDFDVVSNPEFLREGLAVNDFMKPDRVVIGTDSKKARVILEKLYKPFVLSGNPIYFMDQASAEMTKYAANSFLATKISFMNEIANLCELVGADIDAVRLGIGADERIGKRFLFAGIGYGGSCFPKDVKALYNIAHEYDYDFLILEAVDDVNNRQKVRLVGKLLQYYKGSLEGKTFALWGLAFKPDTDDIREAPALNLIHELIVEGAKVVAYDPQAMDNVKKLMKDEPKMSFGDNPYAVLNGADALLVATEWEVFRTPDLDKIGTLLKEKVIFDGRNVFDGSDLKAKGFHYESIGRPTIK